MERDNSWLEEELQVLQEIKREAFSTDPVYQRCRVVTFLSRSAGKRRKRKPREVQFLIIDNEYAHQIKNGEVINRRDKVPIDVLAMEILTDLPDEERSVDNLLERAIRLGSVSV